MSPLLWSQLPDLSFKLGISAVDVYSMPTPSTTRLCREAAGGRQETVSQEHNKLLVFWKVTLQCAVDSSSAVNDRRP